MYFLTKNEHYHLYCTSRDSQKTSILTVLRGFTPNEIFPGKSRFISLCPLWSCNFMPSFGKILCLVFKKSSRQTDEQMADSGHGSIYRTNLLYPWWVQKKQEVIFLLLVISQGIPKIIFLALKVTGGLGGQGYEKIPLSPCKRKP